MRSVGYVRVSTDDQAREGISLAAQRDRIAAHCAAHAIELADDAIFADEGLSGKRYDNRPGLIAALESACAEPPGVLVVYSLSRMARSVRDTLEIAERLDDAGADLVSLTESIDTTTAAGKMIFRMLAVLAEFTRDVISESTRSALAHRRSTGARTGTVPRGFKLADDGRRSKTQLPVALVEDPDEQADIRTIHALAATGLGARTIARQMAMSSGPTWPASTVRSILQRAKQRAKP